MEEYVVILGGRNEAGDPVDDFVAFLNTVKSY